MDPERWRRVGELFHRALEHDPGERPRFLDDACRGDAALRAEVDSLLAHHEDSSPPVVPTPPEEPAVQPSPEGPAAPPPPEKPDVPTPPEGSAAPVPREELAAGTGGGEPELAPGRRLGPYRIARKLGEGGMGVVHLAEDTRLGRLVAVKALPPRFTGDQRRRRRLRREARAAASLTHPGIATVYALEEFDGALCIVSEYVPGETLRQELAAGPLPPADLLDTAIAVARALAAAHEGNVLHRDLKPENVIRTQAGHGDAGIKLVDFGLARFDDPDADAASATQLTAPGAVMGTPGYMAPEQIRGEQIDFRADVFAFGVLLFELATGRHPFSTATPVSTVARVLEAAPPDLRELAPACPPALAAIIRRCLEKDPERRYGATRELVDALKGIRRTRAGSSALLPPGAARGEARSSSAAGAARGGDSERGERPSPAGVAASGGGPERGQGSNPAGGGTSGGRDVDRGTPSTPAVEATGGGDPERREPLSPVWWWQFHQRAAGLVYYAMLYPLWRVREWAPAPWGAAVFFAALTAVLVAANLRFHLSFTERFTPAQLDLQRAQSAPWIRAADWVFAGLLLAATALIAEARPAWASLTAGVGVVSVLTFLAIEPATTRAAFRRRP